MRKHANIAVDSMIWIYILEDHPALRASALKAVQKAETLSMSSLGLGEILAGCEKRGDEDAKLTFLSFLEGFQKLSIIDFGKNEALIFAKLRAKYPSIKPPDAMHLASAISARAEIFLTNDKSLQVVEEVDVQLLSV